MHGAGKVKFYIQASRYSSETKLFPNSLPYQLRIIISFMDSSIILSIFWYRKLLHSALYIAEKPPLTSFCLSIHYE